MVMANGRNARHRIDLETGAMTGGADPRREGHAATP